MKKKLVLSLALTTATITTIIPTTTSVFAEEIKEDFRTRMISNSFLESKNTLGLLKEDALKIGQQPTIEDNVAPGVPVVQKIIKGKASNWLNQFNQHSIGLTEGLSSFMIKWESYYPALLELSRKGKEDGDIHIQFVKGLKNIQNRFAKNIWDVQSFSYDLLQFQKDLSASYEEMQRNIKTAQVDLSEKTDKTVAEMVQIKKDITAILSKIENSTDESIRAAFKVGGAAYEALAPLVDGFTDQAIKAREDAKKAAEKEVPKEPQAGKDLNRILDKISAEKFWDLVNAIMDATKVSGDLKKNLLEIKDKQNQLYKLAYDIADLQTKEDLLVGTKLQVQNFNYLINRESNLIQNVSADFATIDRLLTSMINSKDSDTVTELEYFNRLCQKLKQQL
ncbi:HBL/NHE enterotoxin family protein [Bacillus thuringiensis]|uniref:HBL/NHE enterotoxin family protein n=1 Tax=Bacillus thuringiensis TaxID=1428 RepID=A0AAW9GHE5_BACTU|nr:HBL/NHE enterotoxin family protein [Bacillus thuringiensis]MDY0854358.1 HBL/NHE enterotoxin family protein [Bacillus thuringiensis]MDY4393652.1 HBL/NHE enterotoxin family protein [Bacillus thuringiensis]